MCLLMEKNYKIVVNMKATASFNAEILESQGASTVSTIGNVSLTTSYQEFTFYYQGTGTNDLFIHRLSSASGSNQKIYIKSASVKQVDPNDRWTLGTGWSIEDGKAVFSGTDFANLQLSSTILTIGDTYELTLTAEITNGSFKVQHSGSSDLITESSSGTYSVIFTATATSFTIARASVGSQNDFTIDNVTVREYAVQPKDI